jgi:hypothetical protein
MVATAAAAFSALAPAPAIGRADTPSSPDDTVLDVVDAVLSETGAAHAVTPPGAAGARPEVPVGTE